MPQPKDKDWLNGYKNKTPTYVVYKRPTSKQGDTYRLRVKDWKKLFHANRDQKKAGVAILISDKIDFKTKAVKRDKEVHYILIKHKIKEDINPRRRYNTYKYICTQHGSTTVCKTNANKYEMRN